MKLVHRQDHANPHSGKPVEYLKRVLGLGVFMTLLVFADLSTRKPLPGYVRVTMSIRNESGVPTGARLRVTNAAGDYFAPLGHLPSPDPAHRSAGDLILGDGDKTPLELHALVYDRSQIDLPPGKYTLAARKGFEYEPLQLEIEVTSAGPETVGLVLRKIADLEAKGWFPGDTHIHFPDPDGVRYEMECEGLRVCSLLLLSSPSKTGRQNDGYFWNVEHFTGKISPVSDAGHFIKVGEEYRHDLLAHLIFQNLKSIVWPVSTGRPRESSVGGFDWPLMLSACDDAHQQGAMVSWAHWPYPSMEAPMDIALGRIDSLDLLTTGNPFQHHPILVDIYKMRGPSVYSKAPIEIYYHYLNCGFHLAASAGSDKMGLNPPLGGARTYVKTDGPLSYDSWIEGIRAGHTFVSTYPLLEFSVNGMEAGATLRLDAGKARLRVSARAQSVEPYEVLEIIYNGQVVRRANPVGAKSEARIDDTIEVERGGWIAARAFGSKMLPYGATWWQQPVFAHTSPVYLDMAGRPAPSAESARLFLEQIDYLERWAESKAQFPAPENKQQALRWIAEAKSVYQKLTLTH